MSRTSALTCDSCGRLQQVSTEDIFEHAPKEPFWDLYFHSSNFPAEGQGYRLISIGWDLCSACYLKARNALIEVVGKPNHDQSGDIPAAVAEEWGLVS